MQSLALALAAPIPDRRGDRGRDRQLVVVVAADAATAASAAATAICWERSSISAHMCLTAWKLPIGLPNCSRTLAYSAAVSSAQRATPAASAASTVAARSSNRRRDTASRVAGADLSVTRASGREKSVAANDSTAPRHGGVDQHDVVADRQQQHPAASAPST